MEFPLITLLSYEISQGLGVTKPNKPNNGEEESKTTFRISQQRAAR
jgi:hypothetical protein